MNQSTSFGRSIPNQKDAALIAKILIVDSAPAPAQAGLARHGGRPYGAPYEAALRSQAAGVFDGLDCFILAAGDCASLPQGMRFADFDGIAWTGSPLSAYDTGPVVRHQLDFARAAFESGVPGFGSCWGMQVMSVALGGQVQLSPAGLEFGIGRKITVNATGRGHALYQGKPAVFDALCWHQDEVTTPPQGAVVLASNHHSMIQAMVIEDGARSFWGVQYHPEFDLDVVAALFSYRAKRMATDGFVRDPAEAMAMAADFRALQRDAGRKDVVWRYGIGADVTDPALHRAELANWLRVKVAGR